MMEWCPEHAMKAYLKTLHLRKNYSDRTSTRGSPEFEEPKIMEFLSALAAGNCAKLIVQITTEGVTPVTLALAVAARQIGGKFVCIIPHDHDDEEDINKSICTHHQLNGCDHLKDVIHIVAGNPCEIIKQFKKIDFMVVDSKVGDHLKLLKTADLNSKGSLMVMTNLFINGQKRASLREILKAKDGVYCKSVTIPVGEGIELTKIVPSNKHGRKRRTRFHVTYEN
ncbi:uncharacterized protein [Coffea arabica]|uniref:Uncharacterized protein n=1 Tax=Coffea arabica TaxID=13443 RepID=A0A6P6USM3_COFAR